MIKTLHIFIITIIFVLAGSIFLSAQEKINWLTWEKAMEKAREEDKKIIIDLYTKWCGWCKKMEGSTFQDPFLVQYINEHFIAIKFDAEQKVKLIYKDTPYNFKNSGKRGYHELAAKLTNYNLRYPTLIFLDENIDVIQAIPGFQNSITLEKILTFFSGDYYKSTPWPVYDRNYKSIQMDFTPSNHSRLAGQKKN